MQIAYLISAHTDAPQLARLVSALHADAHFFIHIDAKADIAPFRQLLVGDNIHFVAQREDVVWGTMIEVNYQLTLLREAVAYPATFTHIFFLSGMDYPLWSNERIRQYLTQNEGREFLQGYCMDTPNLNPAQHKNYTTPRPFSRHRRWAAAMRILGKLIGRRKKLSFVVDGEQWHLYKGSAWWCISQELASFILHTYDSKPQMRAYFADSFGPAETLIQTIAFNAPQFASRCILTEGEYPGLAALTPLHFIDYHPTIKVLDSADLSRLHASGKMFCRKIVSGKSDELVAQLDTYRSPSAQ